MLAFIMRKNSFQYFVSLKGDIAHSINSGGLDVLTFRHPIQQALLSLQKFSLTRLHLALLSYGCTQ